MHIDTENTVGHLTTHIVEEGDWLYYKDGYLKEVTKKADELGTDVLFLDKDKGQFQKSPSAKES